MRVQTKARTRDTIKQVRIYATMGEAVVIPAEQARELVTLAEKTLNNRDEYLEAKARREKRVERTVWFWFAFYVIATIVAFSGVLS